MLTNLNILRDKPYADELEEWLMQLLDTNFSLVCEDDSCYEVARHLVNIEDLIGRQDKDKLVDYMKNLPQVRFSTFQNITLDSLKSCIYKKFYLYGYF